jgi:murein DD-endopeptidase MepM/ murein hydrolase activator NlpD
MALKRWLRHLARPITILVIPHAPIPLWRARFSLSFLLLCGAAWTALTVWAGYLAGHRVDYWVTKADNRLLRDKVGFLSDEIGQARDTLDQARRTDLQLRQVLALGSKRAIVEGSSAGGPTGQDRLDLARLAGSPEKVGADEMQREVDTLRRESEERLASFQEITWYITKQQALYLATPDIWPTDGRITSPFGYRFSPFGSDESFGEFHPGVDIANDAASTPILATADGEVRYAGWRGGYGQVVVLDHGHGYNTLYGHTSKIVVRVGDRVKRGDVIATMGTTGRSTGTHLHYEVWVDGKPVNPVTFLGPRRDAGTLAAAPRTEDEP